MTISVSLTLCRSYLRFSFFSLLPLRTYRMAHSFILLLCPIFFILVHLLATLCLSHFVSTHKPVFYFLSRSQVTAPSVLLPLSANLFFSRPAVASITLSRSFSVSLLLRALRFHATSLSAWRVCGPRRARETRARGHVYSLWWRFFVEHNAFLSVHAVILIMPAAGRVTTCAPWFLRNCVSCAWKVSFLNSVDWTPRACAYVGLFGSDRRARWPKPKRTTNHARYSNNEQWLLTWRTKRDVDRSPPRDGGTA